MSRWRFFVFLRMTSNLNDGVRNYDHYNLYTLLQIIILASRCNNAPILNILMHDKTTIHHQSFGHLPCDSTDVKRQDKILLGAVTQASTKPRNAAPK